MLTPLVVADLVRGTGCYNLALGVIAAAQGIRASLSKLAAGLIVDHFGYDAASLTAATVALLTLAVLALALPETSKNPRRQESPRPSPLSPG